MRRFLTIGIVGLAVVTTGCAKGSAESAIAKAEQQVAAIQSDAEKVAPVELRALTDSLVAMKARVATGDYSGALMGARQAGTMTRDLTANLATRRDQLTSAFAALSAELPKELQAVTAKVTELGALKRLPPNLDAAKFATLKSEIGPLTAKWASATESFTAGNLADAMAAGNEVKAKITAAMSFLGL